MNNVKLAIIYYNMTGTNYKMVKWAEEVAKEAGAEIKVLKLDELATEEHINDNESWKDFTNATKDVHVARSEDLIWADSIIFSVPTRFGNIASQMKQFFDLQSGVWAEGKLANKVVSAMSSAQNSLGGQETTVRTIYTTMMHWGAIIVPPG